jgi:hypothetical protein
MQHIHQTHVSSMINKAANALTNQYELLVELSSALFIPAWRSCMGTARQYQVAVAAGASLEIA